MVMDKFKTGLAKVLRKELGLKRINGAAISNVLVYLDSQNVVRKVDGGFPQFQSRLTERANAELLAKQGWNKTERFTDES